MELITFESQAFQKIMRTIDDLKAAVFTLKKPASISDLWLDVEDVCLELKITKRTLQNYRDKGFLGFTKIGGRIFFRASEIQDLLDKNFIEKKEDNN